MQVVELTRKHYACLRLYWQAGLLGLMSGGDPIALDLTASGYLELIPSDVRLKLKISQDGIEALRDELGRERERRRPHHDLALRLAQWLRNKERVTWTNIEFKVWQGSLVRPDVFSLASTTDPLRMNPAVHEVKVSRADFLSDLAKPGKRGGYAEIAEVMYYAAPTGMIDVGEVPHECGLIVESDVGVFNIVKRPKKKQMVLGPHHFMNLILKQRAAESFDG